MKGYIPRPELAEAGEFARRTGEELSHKKALARERTPPERGIECKSCGSLFIETTKTNPKLGYIRRRRRCLRCGFAWHTVEMPEDEATNIPNADA